MLDEGSFVAQLLRHPACFWAEIPDFFFRYEFMSHRLTSGLLCSRG